MDSIGGITAHEYFSSKQYQPKPLFRFMQNRAMLYTRPEKGHYPARGHACVNSNGMVTFNPVRKLHPTQWDYVLAHCLLHLAFGHFANRQAPALWAMACDAFVARFLAETKLGHPPDDYPALPHIGVSSEELLYGQFLHRGVDASFHYLSMAGDERDFVTVAQCRGSTPTDWASLFVQGLTDSVGDVVRSIASGDIGDANTIPQTNAQKAKAWFISSYPLLGALASAFTIVEDRSVCNTLNISVAAIDDRLQEIYFNPDKNLTPDECRFVMAHEILHSGLRHQSRCQGRDPWLWNVACDYVINGWLIDMQIGCMPQDGLLYDPQLKNMSVEEVYARITADIRRYRKMASLRGIGMGDMLDQGHACVPYADVDSFCREALMQGLDYHNQWGRGYLPAGLVEEIRALAQPPIPWDVELARWFDGLFQPLEKHRSYARPSRRQSSSPDIPRPSHVQQEIHEDRRTFGVVLDTSGSMDRALLAKALGAIASYAVARDVPRVRVVFCDAVPYDEGYMPPEDIASRVRVKGRGGTVLQPAIKYLEQAKDFPAKGPILIITDGECDKIDCHREHAFLIPKASRLPFASRGKIFRFE